MQTFAELSLTPPCSVCYCADYCGLGRLICLGCQVSLPPSPSPLHFLLLLPHQEVLLKRAADLVEALYGMPHNNQVSDVTHQQEVDSLVE